jgi:hypothetical protein
MPLSSAASVLFLAAVSPFASSQDPPATPAPSAAKPDARQLVQRVLVTSDPLAMGPAVTAVHQGGAEARTMLRALFDAVAPAAEALPGAAEAGAATVQPLDDAAKQLVADLLAGDAGKVQAAGAELAERAKSGEEPARRIIERSQALLTHYLLRVFRDQTESNAVFAGQYDFLRDLGPAAVTALRTWVTAPPARGNPVNTRIQSIRALRDLVQPPLDEKLAKTLSEVAADPRADGDVRLQAKYALAQFGDRSAIEPELERLQEQAAGPDAAAKAEALRQIAETHYQLRAYEKAVAAYKDFLALVEAGEVDRASVRGLPTMYYNACCSMALAGMTDEAFAYLEKAIDESRKSGEPLNRRLLEVDMDIASLRKDPRFPGMIDKLAGKGRAPETKETGKR